MPEAIHIPCQSTEKRSTVMISMEESAIPVPTPAKCRAARPERLLSARRLRIRVEPNTMTKAEVIPPIRRRPRKISKFVVSPMARVVKAQVTSEVRNQRRGLPARSRRVPNSAPSR